MKITLRKANALQNAIQDHIKTIDISATLSLNEFQVPQAELSIARNTLIANDNRRASLTMALYAIRALVGKMNAVSGVSDYLARAAYIDKRIGQLKTLAESTVVEAETVLNGKLEKLRTTDSKNRMYGYNDNVSTGVLKQEQIDDFKKVMSDLKKEKQSINDKVLELNIKTEIELIEEVVSILQAEQLV